MSDSIREKILKDIKSDLEEVRISNGYQVDLDNVQRWDQDGNDLRNTPCIVIIPEDEIKDPGPDPEVTCRLPVLLVFWFRHDKTVFDCPTDEILSLFLADIEKAVMQDHTRGGNAVTTTNLGNSSFEVAEGQPYCGFFVRIEVLYKHIFSNPYA